MFNGGKWQVTRLADNSTFEAKPDTNGKLDIDGLKVTVTDNPTGAKDNDSFILKPVSNAIVNMKVMVTDESKIAMAEVSKNDVDPDKDKGKSDNRNGQNCWICKPKRRSGIKLSTTRMPRW